MLMLSQKLLKMYIFCPHACVKISLPLISCIVNDAVSWCARYAANTASVALSLVSSFQRHMSDTDSKILIWILSFLSSSMEVCNPQFPSEFISQYGILVRYSATCTCLTCTQKLSTLVAASLAYHTVPGS